MLKYKQMTCKVCDKTYGINYAHQHKISKSHQRNLIKEDKKNELLNIVEEPEINNFDEIIKNIEINLNLLKKHFTNNLT
jgi:hypothetical protein